MLAICWALSVNIEYELIKPHNISVRQILDFALYCEENEAWQILKAFAISGSVAPGPALLRGAPSRLPLNVSDSLRFTAAEVIVRQKIEKNNSVPLHAVRSQNIHPTHRLHTHTHTHTYCDNGVVEK